MLKSILFIVVALALQSSYLQANPGNPGPIAESKAVSLDSFQIAIPKSWRHRSSHSDQDVTLRVFHPEGTGTLKLRSMSGIPMVTRAALRNLTNVDSSILLDWQSWGDLSGYQYDYVENGKFYKQWWLTSQEEILFLVYSSESQDYVEIDVVNRIVGSVTRTR